MSTASRGIRWNAAATSTCGSRRRSCPPTPISLLLSTAKPGTETELARTFRAGWADGNTQAAALRAWRA